jgi:hypothetical protein
MWMDGGREGICGVRIWFCMNMGLLTRVDPPSFRGCTYIPITFYELCNRFLMVINKLWPL